MSLTSHVSADGKSVRIAISGRFDFNLHEAFQSAYEAAGSIRSFTIDMDGVDYMDSSALGMLLLLKEHAGDDANEVKIINCAPEVKNILRISNFDRMFEVI
jgi:anti-anti-sigma factor